MKGKALEIPPAVAVAKKSLEVARIWVADGRQYMTLQTGVWKDPAIYGLLLVDFAKHIANAYEQTDGYDRAETLARIKEAFDLEWNEGTDDPTGSVG